MRLDNKVVEMQDRIRMVHYPLRLTDNVFEDDPLQTSRLKRRYHILQEWYAGQVTSLRKGTGTDSITSSAQEGGWGFNLEQWRDDSKEINNREIGIRWGWDIPLLILRLMSNLDYALYHGNKFLLRESLHGFPIMNYVLNEGPYKASNESTFGGEDFHVILRGDDDNLIYFVPDRDGLKRGRYVENRL